MKYYKVTYINDFKYNFEVNLFYEFVSLKRSLTFIKTYH